MWTVATRLFPLHSHLWACGDPWRKNGIQMQDAFFFDRDAPGGPLADLEQINQWKEVTRTSLTLALTLVGDSTLIYRCWIVWNKRFVVIALPVVLLTALLIVDVFLPMAMANLGDGSTMFIDRVKYWITAALSMTLLQNSLVTSLIVYKIWTIDIRAGPNRSGPTRSLRPVIAIILESGLIYVVTIFIFLVVYVSESNAQYIMVDILNPMIGITFYLLIVRVGLRRQTIPTTKGLSTTMGLTTSGDTSTAHTISVKVQREPSGEFDEELGLELEVTSSHEDKAHAGQLA